MSHLTTAAVVSWVLPCSFFAFDQRCRSVRGRCRQLYTGRDRLFIQWFPQAAGAQQVRCCFRVDPLKVNDPRLPDQLCQRQSGTHGCRPRFRRGRCRLRRPRPRVSYPSGWWPSGRLEPPHVPASTPVRVLFSASTVESSPGPPRSGAGSVSFSLPAGNASVMVVSNASTATS
jgi:hypothetical protein